MAGIQGLFGGGAAGDEQKKKAEDFISRYQTGHPTEGYTEQEALEQLQQVAKVATPQQLEAAFQQSVANLPENDRAQFNEMLQQRKAGKGMIDIERSGERKATTGRGGSGGDEGTVGLDDILGGLLGGAAGGGAPAGGGGLGDVLGQILGGGQSHAQQAPQGGGLGDILGQVLGGGQAAEPAPQPKHKDSGGGLGDILSSPIGKAVLAGTAAFAMKEILGGK